jgi:predicted ArsR family transcriptional regulator
MTSDLGSTVAALGALEDNVRRRMYLFIRDQARPVSRDEAAKEAGISRKLAAFHLDKLVDRGLLQAHYARPPGRRGPGAGRPSKLYEPAGAELSLSIPERRYDLVGQLLVDAIETRSHEESTSDATRRVARQAGADLGREVRRTRRLHPAGPERALSVARDVLRDHGFEPYESTGGELALRNCPFHVLAQRAPELVCGLNQAFVDGLLRGLGNETVEAALEPQPGQCCVKLRAPAKRRRTPE